MYGCWGRIIRVDLNQRKCQTEEIEECVYRNYFGGSGVGAKMLYEQEQIAPALHPHSPLIFMTGALTGTSIPTACRTTVCARSPLTEIWGHSSVGGYWGAGLKAAGFDGIVVEGRADRPVYLWVTPEGAEIKTAEHLWGRDTYETTERIQNEADGQADVGVIGVAGENRVRIASIMFLDKNRRHARAAGRCGMGAAMGAKNVKAIAVKGGKRVEVFDKKGLAASIRSMLPELLERRKGLSQYGTAGGMSATEADGDLPIKNWTQGRWIEGAEATSGVTINERWREAHYGCFACPIRCGKELKVPEEEFGFTEAMAPEYETAAGFGALCLNDDVRTIIKANKLCARYGIDTISASAVIAFAMEAYEEGAITSADTGGVEIRWGDGDAILKLIHEMAQNRGFGRTLAQGIRRSSEAFGRDSRRYAIQTKGLEYPMHDPRSEVGMAVAYATANRGACHLEAPVYVTRFGVHYESMGYSEPLDRRLSGGKGEFTARLQDYMATYDSLGLCKFLAFGNVEPSTLTEWVNLVTDWRISLEEYMRVGERVFNLERLYNVRLGVTAKDDVVPERLLKLDREEGGGAGVLPDIEEMLPEYYRRRGWDENGVPTDEKLSQLGLTRR